jgi:signal transduction histidine kinase
MRDRGVEYRLISDLTSDYAYVYRLDADGRAVCEWQSRSRFLGYDLDQGDPCDLWKTALHPDDVAVALDLITRLRTNERTVDELRVLTRDGEVRWLRHYGRPEWDPTSGRVARVHGAVQDVTAFKRSDADKAALLEIARDIGGTLDVGELLACVQQRTAAALNCDVVVTFRWDDSEQAFCARSQHGVAPELLQDLYALRIPKGTFDGRTQDGHAVLINDIAAQSWLPADQCAHYQIGALIAVPLRVRGRQFGTMAAYNTRPGHGFAERDVELCQAIARQLAVAIEAAELYEAQQQQVVVSGALARVGQELIASLDRPADLYGFCRLVADVLRCDVSQTWLWNAKDEVYVPVAAHGYSREQWEHLQTLRLPRPALEQWMSGPNENDVMQVVVADHPDALVRAAAHEVSVVLQMRLRRGGEVFGIQTAAFHQKSAPFNSVQLRIARGITQLASMALSHARLVDELERVNRLKSDFVATMSHELRTPLNALMGYTDLLACGEFGPISAEQEAVLKRMDYSARELLDLINATLDMGRFENRQVPIEIEPVEVAELLREVDAEAREQCVRRGLQMSWQVSPGLQSLQTDRVKLKVIVKNLVANALKFTERGEVSVAAEARDDGIELSVRDTGIGISAEVLPVIFEPFRQGERATTRRYGGVGLGLYVVRRLLDMLGGTVTVETVPGHGSTFRVRVPAHV